MIPRTARCIAAAFLCAGCADTDPAALRNVASAPAFSFSNGPATLPNIFRTMDGVAGVIEDARTGLLLWGGLPEDPTTATACGGTEPFDLHEIQFTGLSAGVLSTLIKSPEMSLHVYDLGSFTDFCSVTPIAQGTGSITVHDNDFDVTGTRMNVITAALRGTVEFTGGGTAHLIANITIQISRTGEFRIVSSTVRLN